MLPDARHPAARWLPPLLVVLAGLAAYANAFDGVFLLDDLKNVVVSERIHALWPLPDPRHDGRPLVTLSLAVNYALGGLEPAGYHAFNLAVHLLAGLALLGIVRRTVLRAAPPGQAWLRDSAPWIAAAVAVLWTVHPLHTGAVTYVIQRAESMMGLFYLLTLYTFIRGVEAERGAAGWHVASALACFAGMWCKAVMITAPAMVLLYDWVFVGPTLGAILRRRWAVHLGLWASLSALFVNGLVPRMLSTAPSDTATVGFRYKGVSPAEYARTQPEVILYYLRLAFWPARLCLDYMWPVATSAASIAVTSAVAGAAVVASAWATVRRRWYGFLGAWFFLVLAPTSSIVPVRDLAFEHRMYLPLAAVITGVVVLAALALHRLAGVRRRAAVVAAVVLATTATAALAARTLVRNGDYCDLVAMWSKVVDFRPRNARAWNQYGNALQAAGELEPAIAAYERVAALDPALWNAHANRAACLVKLGRPEEALAAWRAALADTDNPAYVHYHTGNTLLLLHRPADAVAEYEAVLALDPDDVPALLDLGRAQYLQRRFDLALRRFDEAAALAPDNPIAHLFRGNALRELGRLGEAAAAYRRALELDPGNAAACDALAYTEQLIAG